MSPGRTSATAAGLARLREGLERQAAVVPAGVLIEHPEALELGGHALEHLEVLEEARLGDEDARSGVGEDVLELGAARRRVERHEDRAEPGAREPRVHDLEPVLRHDRDAVAVAHAALGEARRRGARPRRASRRTSAVVSPTRRNVLLAECAAAWRSSSAGSVRSPGGRRSIRDKLAAARRPAAAPARSRPRPRCGARSRRRAAPRARGPRPVRRRAPSPPRPRRRRRAACRPTSAGSRSRRAAAAGWR